MLLGGIILCVIVLMTSTLITLTEETNRSSANNQMARLSMAVAAQLQEAQYEAAIIASGQSGRYGGGSSLSGTLALSSRLENGWHFFGFDSIYVLDRQQAVIIGAEAGAPAGAAGFRLLKPMVQHLINQVTLGRPSQVGDVGSTSPPLASSANMAHPP